MPYFYLNYLKYNPLPNLVLSLCTIAVQATPVKLKKNDRWKAFIEPKKLLVSYLPTRSRLVEATQKLLSKKIQNLF